MENFAAIDFETANRERSSVCSVGIVIVKNGKIVDKIYRLIRPLPRIITATGTPKYMVWHLMIRHMLRHSLKYGKKLRQR